MNDNVFWFDLAHLIKGKNTLMRIHLYFLLLHRMILWWLPSIPHPTKFKSRHKKLIALILALLYFDHNCCKCQLSNCNHLTYEQCQIKHFCNNWVWLCHNCHMHYHDPGVHIQEHSLVCYNITWLIEETILWLWSLFRYGTTFDKCSWKIV